ncbi:thioester reductase domain-containing protein [Massilia sp. Root335]|uniref:thioester reductase domain-containing protein n=1 Tax=Massilia sp. Root335 TaxID=1736517 RepID=UPI0006F398D7|nr:thioester reductase domain-containing protein [Massilia sp. Root335]KQV49726.1 hypothetical protein ASC93_12785 [Massilia sp. Root335]
MTDQDRLSAFTETYLKSLISEAAGTVGAEFDSFAPFGELGIDSFRVLKIVKALEADFGTLPKTLLFENFNINDLARYFVDRHAATMAAKLAGEGAAATRHAAVTPAAAPRIVAQPAAAAAAAAPAQPILLPEKDAHADPELGPLVKALFDRYKNDGSVSRGTRNIAPNLFIGSARKGYFHYSRSRNIILAYGYTGPADYFEPAARELYEHCARHRLELNLLAADELASIGGVAFSSTPFGVLQRVVDLPGFTLDGNAMRRLRYQVSKFQKAGTGRTDEFRCGACPETARGIAAMIDSWCAGRTMVNPLIHIVRDEILAGTLDPEHRIFLTWLDDVLQNVILVSPLCAELNGYLMDLEFYHKDMPLGGLEFAIVNIVRALVAEGCHVLSLGGTYGCKLENSANADPEVDKILDELRMQNIFNDEGNLQFKNKFRPETRAIYLCRPVGQCDPHNVIDVIMMIADPMKMQTSDEEHQRVRASVAPAPASAQAAGGIVGIEHEARSFVLARSGFNPLNLPHKEVDFDLKTDSWAQLQMPAIDNQLGHLNAQLQHAPAGERELQEVFPFAHVVLTTSGRSAERVFYRAWPKKGLVPQNLLFPTTLFHQIDQGFTPQEMPDPAVFQPDAPAPSKGGLDLAALAQLLERDAAQVAMVCIEVGNNAAGGCPAALGHLKQVRTMLADYAIPLVLDATRVLDNAHALIAHEPECGGQPLWQVVRAILAQADAVVASLPKNFCVNRGGLIATNDPALYARLQAAAQEEGCGLPALDRKRLALALRDRDFIEAQSRRRQDVAGQVWTTLHTAGVPVAQPAGAHCVLVDVKRIPEFQALAHPVASFLAWLYVATGIRAAGHNAGMQQHGALGGMVRLAIPLGLKREQADDLAQRIVAAFAAKRNIPDIDAAGGTGDIHAALRLNGYRAASGALVAEPPAPADAPAAEPVPQPRQAPRAAARDIAIVGMAGRYPKAGDLAQLWDNLLGGADCIEAIPEQRLAQRAHNAFTRRYRGGFIDGVDCFDAPFFGISQRDAEIMDPHERQFLEVAYEAVEDAGYYPELLGGPDGTRDVGVFVGAVWSSYQMIGQEEKAQGRDVNPSAFLWSIANRVSYWMNLSGPSLTLDTACAASLTAIKLACDAIASGECVAAIAGGVNLDLHQSKFDINASGGSLSPDGVCRSFGQGANGYVSGEGVGAVLLKPLAQAIADGDQIHGVIKSAVVTHSGRTSAYTVPNPRPQAALIARALEQGRIDARTIGYVEGHATGTDLGDSIEMAALIDAFGRHGAGRQQCALGSVKTNIGHLEAASGIAGLHKILLQMKHRTLVPSLHSSALNGNVDFANSPFHVQQRAAEWQPKDVDGIRHPLRAGISTIGIGGTNAHVIVEAFEPAPRAATGQGERIFPLSARSGEQLRLAAQRLRACVTRADAPDLDDVSYTLRFGRKCFDHRLAVVAGSTAALAARLAAFLAGEADDDVMPGHVKNASAVTGLLDARERQDFVNLLVQSRDPRRLAKLWSDGVIGDWQGVDIGHGGRRVSLPTYPFARERYWITARQPAAHSLVPVPAPQPPTEPVQAIAARQAEEYLFAAAGDALPSGGGRLELDAGAKALLFVRQAFAGQLGVPIAQVSPDAHLMETGVTSLDMAQMTQAFKQRLDPAFSPTVFFECTTLDTLAASLCRRYGTAFDAMTVARLAADGAAPVAREHAQAPAIASHVDDAASALPAPGADIAPVYEGMPRCVLLTGATGFLGIHVLSEFLASSPALRVLCLVRAQDPAHGLERLRRQAGKYELALDAGRIDVLCGDINRPALGLAPDDWARCALDVDQIVHASAHVNHIEGYATFRASTEGMKEIVRLAFSGRLKLVQFVSSTAACFHKAGAEFSVFEQEAFIADGAAVYGGYGQSKWVQETFLERAAGAGLPYVIYRFGELSGSSRTGIGQTDDMLHRLLQMRLAIGCREKIASDVLDMVPVDFAARLIVGTGNAPPLWNRIVHATHLKPYSFANLYRRAQASGLQFAPVTREQYLARCYDFVRYVESVNPVHGFVLECVLRDAEGSVRKRKIMDGYFAVLFPFAQDNFRRSLQFLGLALPDWPSLLDGYFSWWNRADCGFLARIYDYQKRDQAAQAAPVADTETPLEDVSEA